ENFCELADASGQSLCMFLVVSHGVLTAKGFHGPHRLAAFRGNKLPREHLDQWEEVCRLERRGWRLPHLRFRRDAISEAWCGERDCRGNFCTNGKRSGHELG